MEQLPWVWWDSSESSLTLKSLEQVYIPLTETTVNVQQAHTYSLCDMNKVLRGKQDGHLNGEVFQWLIWKKKYF